MTTTLKLLFKAALIAGVAIFLMAAGANAATISYTTNSVGTAFITGNIQVGNSLILKSSSGQNATLTFVPNTTSNTGVPSNIDLGDFLLVCATCTVAQTTHFVAFSFDLVVWDQTDNATGEFIGTSPGGDVSSNSSGVQVNWQSPLMIGPFTNHALTGNFNATYFDMVSPASLIVAPNSGSPQGDTTVQGQVGAAEVPEPATFGLLGGALMGLGFWRRKRNLGR